ncbi:aspartate aminotransferase, partial [Streptomyces niveus]
ALKAAGRPVIGFGAGEPDFPTPGVRGAGDGAGVDAAAVHRLRRLQPVQELGPVRRIFGPTKIRRTGPR